MFVQNKSDKIRLRRRTTKHIVEFQRFWKTVTRKIKYSAISKIICRPVNFRHFGVNIKLNVPHVLTYKSLQIITYMLY